MHVPLRLNLKFNVTTTDITISSPCFHVITSVWGKSRFEQPPIYLHMGLRDERVDRQGYFGQRPSFRSVRVCDLVCCLTLGFDILIVVLLSPRWIWAIPAPVSPLMPAPPDQHCKCHLFKCKCCFLCFCPGTSVQTCTAGNEIHSHSLECPHLCFYIEDVTTWGPHKRTWPHSQQPCWGIIRKRIR